MDNATMRKKFSKYLSGKSTNQLRRRPSLVPSIYSNDELADSATISFHEIARAIETGNVDFIRRALNEPGDNVIFQDYETRVTVLHCAAKFSSAIVQELLDSPRTRRFLNSADVHGVTPLIVAIWYRNSPAVQILLERGANPKTTSFENKKTSLHIAAVVSDRSIIIELLKWIEDASFLNELDDEGNSALLISAESCEFENAKALLDAGANHRVRNGETGRNVLHYAVLYQCAELLDYLLAEFKDDLAFLGETDSNGATALRLAVELGDEQAVSSLIMSPNAKRLICGYPDVLHRLIDSEVSCEHILRTVLLTCGKELKFWHDDSGTDVLTHAVELGRLEIVRCLLQHENKLPKGKDKEGRTIVHKAVLSKDVEIVNAVLSAHRVGEIIEVCDRDGRTAFSLALEYPSLDYLNAFKNLELIDERNVNSNFETSLFVAAKQGNYPIMLALLLSEACFRLITSLGTSNLTLAVIKRAFLKKTIFTSDVYVLTGEVWEKVHGGCPDQKQLFWTNDAGQNIFHACALGGKLDCVVFIFQYCTLFHKPVSKCLDMKDKAGNTPLMLAIKSGHSDIVKYFILRGANVSSRNCSGLSPLRAIPQHIVEYKTFLGTLMNQFIVYVNTSKKRTDDLSRLTINFQMFLLEGQKSMKVISEFVDVFKAPGDQSVLTHPLVDYFVTTKWSKIRTGMVTRFYVTFIHTLLLSIYLTLKYCEILRNATTALQIFWWLTLISGFVSLLFNLPTFFIRTNLLRSVTLKLLVVAPLLTAVYLVFFDDDTRTSLEIAGFAILMSWHSIFAHGIASPIGRQIAMYVIVFRTVIKYSPVFFIVLVSFALYFFTLFHDYMEFNNPLHSLIFTALQLPEGEMTEIPTLSLQAEPIIGSRTDFGSVTTSVDDLTQKELNHSREARNMLIEGTIVIFYVLCFVSAMNTLMALSIQTGGEIQASGDVARRTMWVRRMEEWEAFTSSRLYRVMARLGLLWALGIPRGVTAWKDLPTQSQPLIDRSTKYDVVRFKHFVTEERDVLVYHEAPSLLDALAENSCNDRLFKVRPSYSLFMNCYLAFFSSFNFFLQACSGGPFCHPTLVRFPDGAPLNSFVSSLFLRKSYGIIEVE